MAKIPYYNCYWCRCAYCVKKLSVECFNNCLRCERLKKTFPNRHCDKFVEYTEQTAKLWDEVQKCKNCKFKKFYKLIKSKLEKLS